MRISIKTLCLFFIGALSIHVTSAQKRTLSFEDAIQIGKKNNTQLKKENNNLRFGEYSQQLALFNFMPTVSANAIAAQRTGNQFIQQEGIVVTGTTDYISGYISANMTLFNSLNKINRLRQNMSQLESIKHNTQWVEQTIQNNIAIQYLQVLYTIELLKIAEQNLAFQQKTLEQIKTESSLGSKARVDEVNQMSEVKNTELAVLRAQTDLRNAKSALALTIMIDPSEDFDVIAPEFNIKSEEELISDIEGLEETAFSNRGDYLAQKYRENSSEYQLKSSTSTFFPSLSAFAEMGSQFNQVNGNSVRSFNEQFVTDNKYFQYGVQLRIPIFNGFQNRIEYMNQKVLVENTKLDTYELENNIRSAILTAVLNYRDASLNYQMSRSQLDAREESHRLNTESYQLGLINLIQYTQSSRDYVQAQSAMASANFWLMFQDILLKSTLGTFNISDIEN